MPKIPSWLVEDVFARYPSLPNSRLSTGAVQDAVSFVYNVGAPAFVLSALESIQDYLSGASHKVPTDREWKILNNVTETMTGTSPASMIGPTRRRGSDSIPVYKQHGFSNPQAYARNARIALGERTYTSPYSTQAQVQGQNEINFLQSKFHNDNVKGKGIIVPHQRVHPALRRMAYGRGKRKMYY
jgi:hypothetical protein